MQIEKSEFILEYSRVRATACNLQCFKEYPKKIVRGLTHITLSIVNPFIRSLKLKFSITWLLILSESVLVISKE